MKAILRHTPIPFVAICAFGQAPTTGTQERFPDLNSLKKWAETESSGGGRLDLVSHGGHEIAIANQMHTSGVTSSAITIFVNRKPGWSRALSLGPYWNATVSFKQKGDAVVLWVEHFDGSNSRKRILTFSLAALADQFDDLKPR